MERLKKRWKAPWLRAHLAHTMGETLLLQVTVLVLWLLIFHDKSFNTFMKDSTFFFLLYGPACIFWASVRLYLPQGLFWYKLRKECLFAGAFLLESSISALLATLILPIVRNAALLAFYQKPGRVVITPLLVVAFGCCFLFVSTRVGLRIWLYWDHLRRTRLRWALTHAQVLVVAAVAFSLSALVVIISSFFRSEGPLFAVLLLFCLFMSIMIALFILPPFALFSHLFIRPTTRRIERLAAATSSLRAGNYETRVEVSGEDEVAHLQADFNAMAMDLEYTMCELQHERDTVSALLQERRELIANVSHDLRTPVATVRSYLESSLSNWNGQPPPTLQQDMRVMEQQTLRLQELIDDLFLLARAEVRQLALRCEPTNIQELAQRVVDTVAPLAWSSSKIDVVLEAPSTIPPALVDASRLEQVLQNLLHNAVRHTPPGGIIAVVVDTDKEHVTLQIKDTGEGIAAKHLPHIWERFYRIESTNNQQSNGAGLGLAIVKELTEAMGGTVSVSSTPGEGACFSLCLPCAILPLENPRMISCKE